MRKCDQRPSSTRAREADVGHDMRSVADGFVSQSVTRPSGPKEVRSHLASTEYSPLPELKVASSRLFSSAQMSSTVTKPHP